MLLRHGLLGLVLASLVLQAAAAAMNPDVLAFLKGPAAPSLEDEAMTYTGRRLQQTFEEPALPFTFDGFNFGAGGWFPGGGAFDGFAVNIYNTLFRDILNTGLTEYAARILPNDLGNPLNFIPPVIGRRFARDVVSVFGFDWADRYIGQYYSGATASQGKLIDAGCVGPTYSLQVNGGVCEILDSGSVECTTPSIILKGTPLTCNLPYRGAASLKGATWQYRAVFGQARSGIIGPPAGVYNFGAAVNVTNPYLGFSAQLQRVANDFGVQQWYQFTGQLILNELVRIQSALVTGDVDRRIYTAEQADRLTAAQAAAGGASGAAAGRAANEPTAASDVKAGVDALRGASSRLMQKIAQRMGLAEKDLTDGLRAAGVPVPDAAEPTAAAGAAGLGEGAAQQPQRRQRKQHAQAQAGPEIAAAQGPAETATQPGASPDASAALAAAPNQGAQDLPTASTLVSQVTNESEGDAALLAQLNKGLAQDNAKAKAAARWAAAAQAKPAAVPK